VNFGNISLAAKIEQKRNSLSQLELLKRGGFSAALFAIAL